VLKSNVLGLRKKLKVTVICGKTFRGIPYYNPYFNPFGKIQIYPYIANKYVDMSYPTRTVQLSSKCHFFLLVTKSRMLISLKPSTRYS